MEPDASPLPEKRRVDAAYLDRLNLLEKSGALDDLTQLRQENRELDTLINDAAGLIALTEIDEMINFVISRLLERFIPSHLVFVIEKPQGDGFSQYYFRNLKKDEQGFPLEYYGLLKDFFSTLPYPLDFEELERRLGEDSLGGLFRSFEPEVLFPMKGLGVLYGVVVLGRKIVGGKYTEPEKMYVDRMIRFLSIGIQNSLHHESSITDAKTGLFNHRHFMQRLDQELNRIARHGSRGGLLMLDVDHFKKFNDSWGHLAGDEALSAISETIKAAVRSEDVPARFGGEEFCVLVIECDEAALLEVAERIRRAVAATKIQFQGQELGVTVSIGCLHLEGGGPFDPELCLSRADRALYLSKTGGRNRCTIYRSGLLGRASALRELGSRR
ncbi:MAG TPA: GGDEF domain-containing protein [Rectinemataceae bacterium]|nr:GGDEF domain-containing protein [Rectinemataceae bacterium]